MCADIEDQRAENRRSPNIRVSIEELADLGIFYRRLNAATMDDPNAEGISEIQRLMLLLGYKQRDEVCCCPAKLPNYAERLKAFFTEHIHEDEEIRIIKDGSGYFDVRNQRDEWVRILVKAGDMIILPAGSYHRFTMDTADFTHAIRLFSEAPRWTPVNRPCDDNPFRVAYVERFISKPPPLVSILGDANNSDNIVIRHPEQLDETVRRVVRSLSAEKKDLLVLLFTGTPFPGTKQSWCPDCVTADPLVAASISDAKAAGRHVVLIECLVERGSYIGNPGYLYRTHPFVQLPCIPTLLVLEASTEEGLPAVKELSRQSDKITADWVKVLSATGQEA